MYSGVREPQWNPTGYLGAQIGVTGRQEAHKGCMDLQNMTEDGTMGLKFLLQLFGVFCTQKNH